MNGFSASVTAALSLFAVLTQTPDARAQTFPAKAITLIVPFPAGGRTDLTARAIAEAMRDDLRQPILVATPKLLVTVSPQQGFLHQFSELDTLGIDRPETKCKAYTQ